MTTGLGDVEADVTMGFQGRDGVPADRETEGGEFLLLTQDLNPADLVFDLIKRILNDVLRKNSFLIAMLDREDPPIVQ